MSGLNPIKKLNEQGIDAKEGRTPRVNVNDIYIPTDGPLAHPRALIAPSPELVAHIKANGVERSILVRRDGVHDGKLRLTLIAGSRRTLALREAIIQLQDEGTLREEQHYIPAKFFVGSDKEALVARLLENSDPLKTPDSPSVLAKTAVQLRNQQASLDEILAAMPRIVDSKSTLEALLRFGDLVPDAAAIFDAGAPLGLLSAVLDAPRDEQVAAANKLTAAGLTTSKGATRLINRERAQAQPKTKPMPPRQAIAAAEALKDVSTDEDSVIGAMADAARVALMAASGDRAGLATLPRRIREAIESVLAQPVKRGRAKKEAV